MVCQTEQNRTERNIIVNTTSDLTPSEDIQKRIDLQRLYVKEQQCKLSRSPQLFKEEWAPEVSMEMQINNTALGEPDLYEAVLHINLTVKNKQITVLTAEVQQAGIFQVTGFTEEERKAIFSTYVPTFLYPYVRQVISRLSVDATVLPIVLTPVNFDALFKQEMDAAQAKMETTEHSE
jgi:preprotein translocase subunit SecB